MAALAISAAPVAKKVPALAARVTQRDSFYKALDPATGLGLRLRAHRAHLDTPQLCTWFRSRGEAELAIARLFGACALEITRCDS